MLTNLAGRDLDRSVLSTVCTLQGGSRTRLGRLAGGTSSGRLCVSIEHRAVDAHYGIQIFNTAATITVCLCKSILYTHKLVIG